MKRRVLSLYLMIAAAAGPWWLCCCSPARAVELLAALKPAAPPEKSADECCCCKHEKAAPRKTAPAKPDAPRLPCECKDTQPTPLVQTGFDADELVEAGKMLVPGDYAGVAAFVVVAAGGVGVRQLLVLPSCGGGALASNQILRC